MVVVAMRISLIYYIHYDINDIVLTPRLTRSQS